MSELQQAFLNLKHHFAQLPYPALVQRQTALHALKEALWHEQEALCQAISQDFGYRSADETRLLEILPVLQGISYQLKNLKRWMKPEKRKVNWLFQPAKNYIFYQPVGVIGIIVPWNYPLFLSLSPLLTAIAAGNKVMLKLSEYTPVTNQVIRRLLATSLGEQIVAVFEGEADIAAEFSALPFDHLLFTGSTATGRKVMQAAAANLTPVTLELGGKSPMLLAADANLASSCERLLFGKTANAGQTCVAPDYLLLPEHLKQNFTETMQAAFNRFYPDFARQKDYSAIINPAHWQRLQNGLQQAQQQGAEIISCAPFSLHDNTVQQRKMPLQLVFNPPLECELLQQEIFGPILPVITYRNIDDAITYIRQQPRPLALYLMSYDKPLQQQVLSQVHAGGICFNDSLLHVAQHDLPFGGIGPSGIGNYHGIEGFKTFSHAKAVHHKSRFSSGWLIYPHWRKKLQPMLNWLLKLSR